MPTAAGSLIADLVSNRDILVAIDNAAVRIFPKAYTFGPHAHRFVEIDYIEEGSCAMIFGTEYVRLEGGDCLVIFPDISHYFFTTLVQVEFALDNFPWLSLPPPGDGPLDFLREVRSHTRSYLKLLPRPALADCMKRIREEQQKEERGREEMMRLLFAQLFILLSRELAAFFGEEGGRASAKPRVRALLDLLRSEYSGELSIEDLAARCGASSRYLRREFRACLGMGIGEYVQELRLRKARSLLADRRLSVLEVALDCGFGSSQYFSRVFRRAVGMSPGQFRELLDLASRDPLPLGGSEKYTKPA
jgi:AraC-like DNA-binding protein